MSKSVWIPPVKIHLKTMNLLELRLTRRCQRSNSEMRTLRKQKGCTSSRHSFSRALSSFLLGRFPKRKNSPLDRQDEGALLLLMRQVVTGLSRDFSSSFG